ncbi:hypothetical protein CO540_00620 [Micromonospora sp. WMMA2032]|uniref:hypothetical protein n=1 Tax=Micromonospora sp. WMMA2032 TaxID=2039870 RepID=UPI000C05AEAD|nr:hypothetical protein [Micromonospora sp. WMMA2032]ATO12528.1 hypothetical protein CO540_00620 [Micromonospora sp. WMMA2032]
MQRGEAGVTGRPAAAEGVDGLVQVGRAAVDPPPVPEHLAQDGRGEGADRRVGRRRRRLAQQAPRLVQRGRIAVDLEPVGQHVAQVEQAGGALRVIGPGGLQALPVRVDRGREGTRPAQVPELVPVHATEHGQVGRPLGAGRGGVDRLPQQRLGPVGGRVPPGAFRVAHQQHRLHGERGRRVGRRRATGLRGPAAGHPGRVGDGGVRAVEGEQRRRHPVRGGVQQQPGQRHGLGEVVGVPTGRQHLVAVPVQAGEQEQRLGGPFRQRRGRFGGADQVDHRLGVPGGAGVEEVTRIVAGAEAVQALAEPAYRIGPEPLPHRTSRGSVHNA